MGGATHIVIEGMSGGVGAILALVSTYPLITITTQLAVDRGANQLQNRSNEIKEKPQKTLKKIESVQDFLELYRGLSTAIIGTGISQGVYFSLYQYFKDVLQSDSTTQISFTQSALSSSLAGCCNVLITNPIWTLVTRTQAKSSSVQSSSRTSLQLLQAIKQQEGLSGLWSGVVPSLIMVCNPTINFVILEWLFEKAKTRKRATGAKNPGLTSGEIFFYSACSKAAATVLTYPIFVVKQRLQGSSKAEGQLAGYGSALNTGVSIARAEGLAGLYKGIKMKLLQSVLAAALLFVSKEKIAAVVAGVVLSFRKQMALKIKQ